MWKQLLISLATALWINELVFCTTAKTFLHLNQINSARNIHSIDIYNNDSTATQQPLKDDKLHSPEDNLRWLVFVSAVPTVSIFVICTIGIAIKNYVDESSSNIDEIRAADFSRVSLYEAKKSEKRKSRQTKNEQTYDKMVADFQENKNRSHSFVDRKSSQIYIEGMEGRSPKTIAQKHSIIEKLNQEDIISSRENILNMTQRSQEDLLEIRKTLTDDINEVLLPEDLQKTFTNFEDWDESLL